MSTGIDLHTHSTASDGTFTPAQVMAAAAAAGLHTVALTDHDSHAGVAEAAAALPPGLTLVAGAEISCFALEPDGARVALHLLAYLADPEHPEYAAALAALRASRTDRAKAMVDLLVAGGYAITFAEVQAASGGGTIGRPHLGEVLVAHGYATDVQHAFRTILGDGSPYRVPKADLPVLDAIRMVRRAGGVPVFAHPDAHRRGPVVSERTIAAMAGAGLAGLEVDHLDHDPASRIRMAAVAGELGLLCTGSSDFHGTRKTVALGAETTRPEVWEALLCQATGAVPVTAARVAAPLGRSRQDRP